MINMLVIGITGTLGAGKGTIVDYLKKEKDFLHYSVRRYLIDEIEKQGLPVNRDTMTATANALRKAHHPAYIVEALYQQAVAEGKNAVIESIRTPGEVEFLKKHGKFYLFALDADLEIRYRRIRSRGSETDYVDYKTFIANEQREMTASDPNKQNLGKCIQMADFRFDNNGSIQTLYTKVNKILDKILL